MDINVKNDWKIMKILNTLKIMIFIFKIFKFVQVNININ